jgi:hypothetical protein
MTFLTNDEKAAITTWVTDFPDQLSFEVFVGRTGDRLASFSSRERALPHIAYEFIIWLDRNPEKIGRVLQFAKEETPYHASMHALAQARVRIDSILQRRMVIGNAWDAPHVDGIPVINRGRLRSALSALTTCSRPPVIMVNGDAGTGRSHSFHLIAHVARAIGVRVLRIKMEWFATEEQTIQSVFDALVYRLQFANVRSPTTVGATPETIAARFARAFQEAAEAQPVLTPTWLVFDSIDRPLPPELKRFFCELAHLRLDGDLRQFIMFLLGAGPDYGIDDAHLQAHFEPLTMFLPSEIEETARALNSVGTRPLEEPVLQQRIHEITALLHHGPPENFRLVARRMSELREEVAA